MKEKQIKGILSQFYDLGFNNEEKIKPKFDEITAIIKKQITSPEGEDNNTNKKEEQMTKQKFERATLADGTPIWISALVVGGEVFIIDENMAKAPIFDGEHILTEETTIVTVDGKITEIKPKSEMTEEVIDEEEEVIEEEMAEEVIEELPIDEAAVLAIIQPKLDELYAVIAEIKTLIESDKAEDIIEGEMKAKFEKQIPSLKKLFSSMR